MVLGDFLSLFEKSLGEFIDLSDQSRNKRAAYWGSMTGDLDTIDLSSASDLLSMKLIKAIMPRKVQYWLLATRSGSVRTPNKDVRSIEKYAPMGSALCFPVQCSVFLGVIIYASTLYHMKLAPWSEDFSESDIAETISSFSKSMSKTLDNGRIHSPLVYGDDLVVDSKLTEQVSYMLESLGFKVNASKSYKSSCAFRESCGGFYWNGFDITPLRFRLSAECNSNRITRFAERCALINQALDFGYLRLRTFLIKEFRKGEYPLFFTDKDNISCSVRTLGIPYNHHLDQRWNIDLQRTEARRCIPMPKKTSRSVISEHERYRYMRWWATAESPPVALRINIWRWRRSDSFDSRPSWVWTPTR